MKKIKPILFYLLFVIGMTYSCEDKDPVIMVTAVSLNKTSLTLIEAESDTLTATVLPDDATNKEITWESSDESIASVDQNGKVTANKAGIATITVTTVDGEKTAECTVTVEPKVISVTSVSLDNTSLTLVEAESDTLTATVLPDDATNKEITWESSDESIASVDQNGKVTANKAGIATITVTTVDGEKTAECTVTVEPKVISVTSVSLDNTSLTLVEAESDTLTATVLPEDATNKDVTWGSSDESVASVDQNGKVTANKAGVTTITVTTVDGEKTAECTVTVREIRLSLSQVNAEISDEGGLISIDVIASDDWTITAKPDWVSVTPLSGFGSETEASKVDISVSQFDETNSSRTGNIIFKLNNRDLTAIFTINQYNNTTITYEDGEYLRVQSSTEGDGIDIVFVGDGYTTEDIVSGQYSQNMNDAINHFFDIEPYRTYRNYFDVYIIYAISEESGISDHNTTKNTTFSSKYESQNSTRMSTDIDKCMEYAEMVPLSGGLSETLITVITNSSRYAGTAWLFSDGMAISIVPVSNRAYPYDFRSVLQHESGGHGFGKLADEYASNDSAIPEDMIEYLRIWQDLGHYKNVDVTNNLSEILWNHFIDDPSYSYVGAYEGGFLYSTGVWRPEPTSLMINNISYINAPGRELIVKRIKQLAGEAFSFEEFKLKDVRETNALTRSANIIIDKKMLLPPPILIRVD